MQNENLLYPIHSIPTMRAGETLERRSLCQQGQIFKSLACLREEIQNAVPRTYVLYIK